MTKRRLFERVETVNHLHKLKKIPHNILRAIKYTYICIEKYKNISREET